MAVVTDTALSRLGVEDFLAELLDRLRDLLAVDTAEILLLDRHAQQLVATVATGIGAETRQDLRISIGHGFAGRIAIDKQRAALAEVHPGDEIGPVLRETEVQSLLGVPLVAGGDLVGVMYVGSVTPRTFSSDDAHLLELAADRAAAVGQAQLGRDDRTAALALQRSLLPTRLPDVPGVELAARYVPGHRTGVGGDWYDVFTLPSGWLGIVVGDVSGHGLAAAVVMGRLRSALRAYALECDDPADALTRLDQKIHHFETGSLATALYAMISPDRGRMLVSLAGHLPPFIASPGHPAVALELPVDLPLGTGHLRPRHSTGVSIPEQGVIVAYTDGLVERREESIDVGLQRLADAIHASAPDALCATIMANLGSTQPTDDIALLTIRRRPTTA